MASQHCCQNPYQGCGDPGQNQTDLERSQPQRLAHGSSFATQDQGRACSPAPCSSAVGIPSRGRHSTVLSTHPGTPVHELVIGSQVYGVLGLVVEGRRKVVAITQEVTCRELSSSCLPHHGQNRSSTTEVPPSWMISPYS